uniref:Transposase n=1 Tax=uncultured Chloroflexota bacterium TaxID=166587 RepID=H5SBF0_9CHLR|nr:transposase [uncultured Chloroflexota bacterium]
MRIGLVGQVRRVWAPRGVKVEQLLEYRREWAYLNLGVNGLIGKLIWGWAETMKSEAIAAVVREWGAKGVKAIAWDRARGHYGSAYENVEVKRVEQPPYSPELNPAERIFEYLRSKVEGKLYRTLAEKQAAIEAELKELAANPEKVKSLAGWDWIRQSLAGLQQDNTVFQ